MRNMNNDFAKSILDNPYNRVEDGQKIDLFNVLEKYSYQRQNIQLSNLESDESSINFSGWLMERPLWSYGGYDLTP